MKKLIGTIITVLTVCLFALPAFAETPDCQGPERWPEAMTYGHLKRAGILTPDVVDFTKTTSIRLVSEQIGPDLHRQAHLVRYVKFSGEIVEAIAISDASSEECSMSGVEVFLISRHLGEKP